MVTAAKRIAHGIDLDAVEGAIRAAEQRTSGEICVAIARSWFWADTRAAAERAWRRKVVVLGDAGIHAKVAPDFWNRVVERITADFRRGDPTAGMVAAVELLGNALASAFPASAADVNELPNSVTVE